MNKISIQYVKTPAGELVLGAFKGRLCLCDWRFRKMRAAVDKRIQKFLEADYEESENEEVLSHTKDQLEKYFSGKLRQFDLPLLLCGTTFQQKVWNELLTIGFGTTTTYMKLSEKLKNKEAIRAVAAANGANAISIIVPCHRVIGSHGELIGYAGGLPAKEKLLKMENPEFGNETNGQIKMEL